MKKILVINGPNLNLLGEREPDIYGDKTLQDIELFTNEQLNKLGFKDINITWYQSNAESEIVEAIQTAKDSADAIVINPAAFTHTSIAILDALKAIKKPTVEVHLSNTNLREEFRKNKVTTLGSDALIEGTGYRGYLLAILSLLIN